MIKNALYSVAIGLEALYEKAKKFLGFQKNSVQQVTQALEMGGRVDQNLPTPETIETDAQKQFLENLIAQLDDLWKEKVFSYYPLGKMWIKATELERVKSKTIDLTEEQEQFLIALKQKILAATSDADEEWSEEKSQKIYVPTSQEVAQLIEIFGAKDEKAALDMLKKIGLSSEYRVNKVLFGDNKTGPVTIDDVQERTMFFEAKIVKLQVLIKDLQSNTQISQSLKELYLGRMEYLLNQLKMHQVALVTEWEKWGLEIEQDFLEAMNQEALNLDKEINFWQAVSDVPEERNLCIQEFSDYFQRNNKKLSDEEKAVFQEFLQDMSQKYNFEPEQYKKKSDKLDTVQKGLAKLENFNLVVLQEQFEKAWFSDEKTISDSLVQGDKKDLQSFIDEVYKTLRSKKEKMNTEDVAQIQWFLSHLVKQYDLKEFSERERVVKNAESLSAEQLKEIMENTMKLYQDYQSRNFQSEVTPRDVKIDSKKKNMDVEASSQTVSLPSKSRTREAAIQTGLGHELEKHWLSGVNTSKFLGKTFKGPGYLDFEEWMAKIHEAFVAGKISNLNDIKDLAEKPGIGLLTVFVCENYPRKKALEIMTLYSRMWTGTNNPEDLVDRRKRFVADNLPWASIKDAVYYRGQKKVIDLLTQWGTLEEARKQFESMSMKLWSQDLPKLELLKKELGIQEWQITLPLFLSKIIFDKLKYGKGSLKKSHNLFLSDDKPKLNFSEKRKLVKIIQASRWGDERLDLVS